MEHERSPDVIPEQRPTTPTRTDALRLVLPDAALISPSLTADGTGADAYELKFLLGTAQARAVEELARTRLAPDPHGDPARGGAYHTTSLYCDTEQFDVFHRRGPFRRHKHRVRRYGDADRVFFERKSKWGDRVRKLRCAVPAGEVALLGASDATPDWPGHWFHEQLREQALRPACLIAYDRVALVGMGADGPVRVTFDRAVRGIWADTWGLHGAGAGWLPLLDGLVIVEFKYRTTLPTLCKEIVQELRLTPSAVSKYRSFMRASGRVADGGALDG